MYEEKITIGDVERITGLSKDLLRTWERRYGFPTPVRSENDEREYSQQDLDRLITIKKLLDNGLRPRKVVPLSDTELALLAAGLPQSLPQGTSDAVRQAISLLQNDNLEQFSDFLTSTLISQGLDRFVNELVAPLNHEIGEAWFRGEIGVFHEHCYASRIEALLVRANSFLNETKSPPRVLLTTLSGELHYLGLLMARAVLGMEKADAILLGPQLPNNEIKAAAEHFAADIVALSFSSYFPLKRAHQTLITLRAELPASVTIWAGGGSVHELGVLHDGILFFSDIAQLPQAVADWRQLHQ
jgi:MerR family transcriptional regulator, light-induced transcriptional regulator